MIFLPVHIMYYLSKWQVDGTLHKAMPLLWYCELQVLSGKVGCLLTNAFISLLHSKLLLHLYAALAQHIKCTA